MRQEASGYCGFVDVETQGEATAWDRSLPEQLARRLARAIKSRPIHENLWGVPRDRLPHYLVTRFHRQKEEAQ